ncbi:MAG: NAD-dependent epimerase/dehydratase family protein [Nitrospirota bacterium]
MRSERVLITGGTGFVGSHLAELLLRKGYRVTCLVRDTARLRWLTGRGVNIVRGDCSDPASLVAAVKDVSVVFHAAGLTKARRPREYYEVNHLGTRNLLEACNSYNPGIGKFILVSSLAAAGPSPDGKPVRDIDAPRPVSDYGKSKLLAEGEALGYKDRFPVVILRPSAVYGPRDGDLYELFRYAVKGLTLEISGGDRFINPCYVEDLAEAMLLSAQREAPSGSIYFVSEKRTYSWAEFGRTLLSTGGVHARNIKIPYWAAYGVALLTELGGLLSGKAPITNRQKVKEAVQKYWICDVEKIERDLGFRAAYPLERGLTATWRWYRENGWI